MNRCLSLLATGAFVLACAAGAAADNDVMCICVDDDAAATCGGNVEAEVFGQLSLYLCVLEPSESQIKAWEAYLDINGDENLLLSTTLLGDYSINVGQGEREYVVGAALDPLRPNSANLVPLLAMNATILGEDPIFFYIRPVPGSISFPDLPGYAPEVDVERPCTPCGGENAPDLRINAPIEESSWGEVKELYGN